MDNKRHDDLVEQDECTDRTYGYQCERPLPPAAEKFLEERFHGVGAVFSKQSPQT